MTFNVKIFFALERFVIFWCYNALISGLRIEATELGEPLNYPKATNFRLNRRVAGTPNWLVYVWHEHKLMRCNITKPCG